MTPRDIARLRLINQQIAATIAKTPAGVVASFGAMQAQDYNNALWAVGLRSPSGTAESDIQSAVSSGKIIRTWPMRGTLHFVANADIRWMLELLTPRIIAGSAARQKSLSLTPAIFAKAGRAFERALSGGRALVRDEACAMLEKAGISTADQRGYHLLWRLAQERVICFGPRSGNQPTFVLFDEWAPAAKSLPAEEALAELATRYFQSHGPATIPDFVWWSGLKVTDAKSALASVAAKFQKISSDGTDYWMPPELPDAPALDRSAYLLPSFEEFLLGYRDRTAVLDLEQAGRVVPGSNGIFMPIVVINGRVSAIWKKTLRRNQLVVTIQPFHPLKKREMRECKSAATRYAEFKQTPAIAEFSN